MSDTHRFRNGRNKQGSSGGSGAEIPSVLPGLVDKGLGQFLDDALRRIVIENKDTIHDIVDNIIALTARSSGKGRKAGAPGGGSNNYSSSALLKVSPTSVELRHSCHTSSNTRSVIEPMHERKDSTATVGEQLQEALQECKDAVDAIVTACKRKKVKFFDESFYYDRIENLIPEGSPADCTVGRPQRATRLSELFKDVALFADEVSGDDIVQGQVGDCFLIGAISALAATVPSQIKRLFAAHDLECGVFGVLFFKCGSWEWVIVDDFIAVEVERSGSQYPLFASSSGERKELWPLILEKAYAKMHYNWDMIDGGWAKEALVDMTGGLEFTMDLFRDHKNMTFDKFHAQVVNEHTVLGCAVGDNVGSDASGGTGNAGEAAALNGLFHGHQYAVLESRETRDGTAFVHVRNPWGNDAEWTGPYSDNSKEWMENPDHKKELMPEFKDDGAFWIKWTDFKYYLSLVDIVRTFPSNTQTLTIYGKAESYQNASNTYILQVCDTPTKMAIALCQDDPKMKYGRIGDHKGQYKPYAPMKLDVFKLREVPKSFDDIQSCQQMRIVNRTGRDRSVHTVEHLDPGLYSITALLKPSTSDASDDLGMFLRIIGPADADYSLFRWGDGEKRRLVIGDCPLIAEVGVYGIDAVSQSVANLQLMPRTVDGASPGSTLAASTVGRPSAFTAAADAQEISKLKKDLLDNADYVKQLESLIAKQQRQIDALNAAAAASTKIQLAAPTPQPPAAAAGGNGRLAANSPTQLPSSTPWGRLKIDKSRWTEVIRIVFDEVGMSHTTLTADEALNGVRLLVTAGCGLDDVCVTHPIMTANKNSAPSKSPSSTISKREFEQLCSDALMKWSVLEDK